MPKKPERKPKPYRFVPLPENFHPIDATIEEVRAFRRESRWSVFNKLRNGTYESYLDGRVRKIIFATVLADRERAMAVGRDKQHQNALHALAVRAKKRPVGRPKKPKPESPAHAAE